MKKIFKTNYLKKNNKKIEEYRISEISVSFNTENEKINIINKIK